MRYEQRMRKYWQKKLEDPLPKLPEDERIYLNVPYMARDFAKYSHCGFDPERKLWFTGSLNRNLYDLVELYGVNEATSEKAKPRRDWRAARAFRCCFSERAASGSARAASQQQV